MDYKGYRIVRGKDDNYYVKAPYGVWEDAFANLKTAKKYVDADLIERAGAKPAPFVISARCPIVR